LLGSPEIEDRKRALRILHEELMPQLSVNFKVLGSPEYSKITLEYYTHLFFFQEFRPDLYAAIATNGTRLVDEVSIELEHAFVATHFVMVQMAHSDYKQSVEAFTARGPMIVLQTAISELAALKTGAGSRNPAAQQLQEDTAVIGVQFRKLLSRYTESARDRDVGAQVASEEDVEVVREQVVYCRWAGGISKSMLPCCDVDGALDEAVTGLLRDLHSTTNAKLVNETIAEFKQKFYDENTKSWQYRPASELRRYWEGDFLPSDLAGLTRKITRQASAQKLSAASAWQGPRQGDVVNFEGFGGFLEIIEGWLNMLPQQSKKRAKVVQDREHGQSSTDADHDSASTYSHDSESTRAPSVSGDVEDHSGEFDEESPQIYDSMPDITSCSLKFRDKRGILRDTKLVATIGIDEASTHSNIRRCMEEFLSREFTGKRGPAGNEPLSDVHPKLVSIECGIDFHVSTQDGTEHDRSARDAVAALHVHIKEHMSAQFGTALDLLASKRYAQVHNLACLIERSRPSGAADLNADFTNTAMSMCITAVARAARGVELMNRAPDVSENRVRARDFLRDALDDIVECLEGKTRDSALPWISSSHRHGAGITLRSNLAHMMQTIMDMQQAIAGYAAQNPADDLF